MHLAEIRIHPVKALRATLVPSATVEPWGLALDRRWMVVDAEGRLVTQREHPVMATIAATHRPGGLLLRAGERSLAVAEPAADAGEITVTVWRDAVPARAAPEAAAFLTEAIGAPCRLVWMHDPTARAVDARYAPSGGSVNFSDGFPVLLATTGSLADLNDRLPQPVPIGRFRANLVIAGASPWDEDRWRRIRVGAVVFAVVKPCDRCIVTTIDPDTGERPDRSEPLRTLGRFRRDVRGSVMFGQNLVPLTGGEIHVGDELGVLEAGEPNVTLIPANEFGATMA